MADDANPNPRSMEISDSNNKVGDSSNIIGDSSTNKDGDSMADDANANPRSMEIGDSSNKVADSSTNKAGDSSNNENEALRRRCRNPMFNIRVHHSGVFDDKQLNYIGGSVCVMDGCQVGTFSYIMLSEFVKKLGCKEMKQCWYVIPTLGLHNGGLVKLVNESAVTEMLEWVTFDYNTFVVYIEHVESTAYEGVGVVDPANEYYFDFNQFDDDMYEMSNESDDEQFDVHDKVVEYEKKVQQEEEVNNNKNAELVVEDNGGSELGFNSEYDDSDDLRSLDSNSDGEEVNTNKKAEFIVEKDMANPEFKLGMKFADCKQFRDAVKEYAIKNKKSIKLDKNEKWRLRAVCASPCPWFVYVSKMQTCDTLIVKTIHNKHVDCRPVFENKNINSTWLASKYVNNIRSNPEWPLESFRETVRGDHSVDVSRSQVYRAKKKARAVIDGNHKQQFEQLWNYCKELKRAMPGTTTKIDWIEDPTKEVQGPIFRRMYCSLGPLKQGFKAGCRPFLCLDGCFLKGPWPGQLLSAVAIDANDGMYPMAYAVVEKEGKSSWKWFVEILVQDLGIMDPSNWTFMSDQQKGLDAALRAVIPDAEHRFCMSHLHSNFRKDHGGGKLLKDALWKCARASTEEYFNECVKELLKLKGDAAEWFVDPKHDPKYWSRSYFSETPKCDLLHNNHCEIFNSFILSARDKPIITLFETIRRLLMIRIRKNRDKMRKYEGTVCARICKRLDKHKLKACGFIAEWSVGPQYEVTGPRSKVVVDLEERTCSCRKWQLSGVPCSHSIAAMNYKGDAPENYVHKCFTKGVYLKCYEHIVLPINGEDLWPQSGKRPLNEPVVHVQPGRKKKMRNKTNDEPKSEGKLGKQRSAMTCGHCGTIGHNKRSYRNMGTKNRDLQRKQSNVEAGPSSVASKKKKQSNVEAGTTSMSQPVPRRSPRNKGAVSLSQPIQRSSPRKKLPIRRFGEAGAGSQP